MSIFLAEAEEIYFSKTKEYFQEVISSYSIGNYRSATVMLYSVAICDLLFKLQELKDMFNDTVAQEILSEVDKSRNSNDNKAKSKWEKELVDSIYKKTELLDLEAYTNLNHLYDHRNFSAHPALNENYELVAPSKETTIANIKNVLKDILVKPPIFIKNIVDTLTEDLNDKKDIYKSEDQKLAIYLNNKYFSKMSKSMKFVTLKAFWKFCFCLPDDEDCQNNLAINRKALQILIDSFYADALEYIKNNESLFPVANNESCQMNLIILLSELQGLYCVLDSDTKLQVVTRISEDDRAKSISWFKYDSPKTHFDYLKSIDNIHLEDNAVRRMVAHYETIGEMEQLIDFFIWYYGESGNFDSADERFGFVIEPFINIMVSTQFEQIIKKTNSNSQIYGRRLSYSANNQIVKAAKNILSDDFDYSQYTNFRFDKCIIQPSEEANVTEEIDLDLPF